MKSLAELFDPDQWIASGRNLTDLPWPPKTEKDRKAMKLILADHPKLAMHLARWATRVAEAGAADPGRRVGDVLTEEQLRAFWNETRITALS